MNSRENRYISGRLRPQGAQAEHGEHCGWYRTLDEYQPGVTAQQAEHRADDDARENQHADRIDAAIFDELDRYTKGGEGAAQHERGDRAQALGSQQRVDEKRPADVEYGDHRQRLQPAAIAGSSGSLSLRGQRHAVHNSRAGMRYALVARLPAPALACLTTAVVLLLQLLVPQQQYYCCA
jgi:hypothetical protein